VTDGAARGQGAGLDSPKPTSPLPSFDQPGPGTPRKGPAQPGFRAAGQACKPRNPDYLGFARRSEPASGVPVDPRWTVARKLTTSVFARRGERNFELSEADPQARKLTTSVFARRSELASGVPVDPRWTVARKLTTSVPRGEASMRAQLRAIRRAAQGPSGFLGPCRRSRMYGRRLHLDGGCGGLVCTPH
jgi:hypothetical protein